ncbi:isocitrate lyase/phosphoenolpyruvate mutase family protein [Micromonospora sp. WMMD1082]|uniref:isocitrate lyase/PEP mutase family protein n=1 Tax=Micromonospora sp. WMMD1082 TaxID=3016104 RepID=UPI0024179629|nr:isocitrate lyase/phosphoenolpyruvate mutase family protein [Micromonospora sp. WMMD1082]MDG4797543.1 isocitrate lyase/phosphoenolpyruvate mutase family protein [Micromonospora sp. WMMD1082]
MTSTGRNLKARRFRELSNGRALVLPNAWDAASAAVMVRSGAVAVATTSGGVAWAWGRSDGEGLARAEMIEAVRRIADAVDVPVTADLEGGYGPAPEDVARTVRDAIDSGVVGMNLEDSRAADGTLLPPEQQAERIRAGREAANAADMPDFVLNARTDVYLRQVGDVASRLDEVLARAESYAEAGADGLFVPGLVDIDALARLTAAIALPVNAMAGPGTPSIAELVAVGVRRISVGTAIAEAALGLAARATRELLAGGTYASLEQDLTYAEINALFA